MQDITDGINIVNWALPYNEQGDAITYSVWDFAGQSVYYNTHQVLNVTVNSHTVDYVQYIKHLLHVPRCKDDI